jgi:hypothetical protein
LKHRKISLEAGRRADLVEKKVGNNHTTSANSQNSGLAPLIIACCRCRYHLAHQGVTGAPPNSPRETSLKPCGNIDEKTLKPSPHILSPISKSIAYLGTLRNILAEHHAGEALIPGFGFAS